MLKNMMLFVGSVFMPLWVLAEPLCRDDNASIVGAALNEKTQKLLYCERYYQLDESHWRVDYHAGKKLIVQKTLDYSLGLESPLVVQEDLRSGELRVVTVSDDLARWRVQYRANVDDEKEVADISRGSDQVVDAGFDAFVRQKWGDVIADSAIVFNFLSIPHLRSIPLRAKRVDISGCDILNVQIQDGICIRVEANNRLLRFFVDRLTLLYDPQKRLRAFNGPVNIQSDTAKTQKATIVYQYKVD